MAVNYAKGPTFPGDIKQAIETVRTGAFTTIGSNGETVRGGTYTMVAGDATANLKDITTGLTTITGLSLLVLRAGVNVLGDAVVTVTAGVVRIADGSTYNTTAGDVVRWVATGTL